MKFKFLLPVLASLSGAAFASIEQSCGEGGPGTFLNLADTSSMRPITTQGKVKEVLFWEGKNTLVYRELRNARNLLIEHNLDSGKTRNLGTLDQPMSNVIDPDERFILTRSTPWIMDSDDSKPEWQRIAAVEQITGHLFWNFRDLYSLASTKQTQSGHRTVSINYYHWGELKPRSCTLRADPRDEFFLGEGSQFPTVYLYKTRPSVEPGRTELTLLFLKVKRNMMGGECEFEQKVFQHPIRGQVKEVHFFNRQRVAIRTHDPIYSLMWWNGERELCKYFSLGNKQILVPNHSRHTFFTYDPEEGLEMYFPKEDGGSKMFLNHPVEAHRFDALWLNSYGDRLYTVGRPGYGEKDFIAEINIKADYSIE